MKTYIKCSALLAVLSLGASLASAASVYLDFDSTTSAVDANTFAVDSASWISFHNAMKVSDTTYDSDGNAVTGTAYWTIDTSSDASNPVQVASPSANGWGSAPSGNYALDARDQSVLIQFDQAYDLTAFSVTLDNSSYGTLGSQTIDFLSGSDIIGQITIDQTTSGLIASLVSGLSNVTGIVLPSTAFYDNLSISGTSAIPEPSTWAAIFGGSSLAMAMIRRRRRV